MDARFRTVLNAVLIIAFVTMGISPACHFINGADANGYIEICTDEDEVQRITLAEAGFAPKPKPAHNHEHAQPDCAFCFAASSAQAMSADAYELHAPGENYHHNGRGLFTPHGLLNQAFEARGPPISVV